MHGHCSIYMKNNTVQKGRMNADAQTNSWPHKIHYEMKYVVIYRQTNFPITIKPPTVLSTQIRSSLYHVLILNQTTANFTQISVVCTVHAYFQSKFGIFIPISFFHRPIFTDWRFCSRLNMPPQANVANHGTFYRLFILIFVSAWPGSNHVLMNANQLR